MKWGICIAVVVLSCGPSLQSSTSTSDPTEYPCLLGDPSTLRPDFMVRQTLVVHAVHDGKPIDTEFDAVVQKQGDTLRIVGLGPADAKVFALEQRASRMKFTQFIGPALPFSPRNILVDVHRVYFKRLAVAPSDEAGRLTGVRKGVLDGELVEESWQDGQLRSVAFTRPDSPALRGAIRITFGLGCRHNACEPETVTLRNEWFGYRLDIASRGYERL